MPTEKQLEAFKTDFVKDNYTPEEQALLAPFFSNLDQSVYAPLIFSPEVIGALCSRTSRAVGDLRKIFLDEYITPFLQPERSEKDSDEDWQQKVEYGEELRAFITFLQDHPIEKIFSNPRARSFYTKWLAQYGDDSIAQMAGMHLVYSGVSQVAIKHFEDQRIGLAPLEKSTRYINYGEKINGSYQYYTDPTLADHGVEAVYRAAMDGLFEAYGKLKPQLITWLTDQFPDEKSKVIETKAFDTLRGLLPTSTLSQVAFFGNGQAFEYMIARSLGSRLGEISWAADRAYEELYRIAPSFLRRIKSEEPAARASAQEYQEYKAGLPDRMARHTDPLIAPGDSSNGTTVALLEYDPLGQEKVITGLLYSARGNHRAWVDILAQVQEMTMEEKDAVLANALDGRTQRWQKVPRAFENANVRFEITMNIGSWRDLHRHRMLTQQRQFFTVKHGYDTPPELIEAGLADSYHAAIKAVEDTHHLIATHSQELAQYAVTLAHRIQFMQWENLRECFWEMELRTIPEGHPDYRAVEQEKFRQLEKAYPLITKYMHVNMDTYDFARRGQDEKIQAKLEALQKMDLGA
ncbi:hypothetical protein CL628_04670 [bacterium]|nr:hypothetical protein [bacterium]